MYQISLKLAVPNNLLSKLEHQSNNLSNKLENDFEKVFLKKKLNFVSVKKLLVSNSFHRVLKRSFALIIDENEKPIKSSDANPQSKIKIKFYDKTRKTKFEN